MRFVDDRNNFSNLSPLAGPFTAASTTGVITGLVNSAPIIITSAGHGLLSGATVTVAGVEGTTGANGTWQVTVLSASTFSLNFSGDATPYLGGGTWSAGVLTVTYSGVPTSSEAKVARRQLLRNTAGEAQVFYVDVDTTDLTSTSFTSSLTDVLLAAQPSQALFDPNGVFLGGLYTVPPAHKAVLAQALDRMFLAVNVEYSQGCVAVSYGSSSVQGVGTEWSAPMAGRVFYALGAAQSYAITAVDVQNQVLTLATPYLGPTDPYLPYAIAPGAGERRLLYYSEAGLPEAWPATNALAIQEDGDDIVGLMARGSFLYILERSHIYRFTFQSDPATDGYVFLSGNRGCVNNRCWVLVEDTAYLLDEAGAYTFSGGEGDEPLTGPIQNLFEVEPTPDSPFRINWAARAFFHAVHSPAATTVRWFVALSGSYLPRHALAYDYRLKRWWVEEYPFPVGSSVLGRLQGELKVFLGGPAGRIFAHNVGTLDGPDPGAGTVRGTATSATLTSLTDSLASFPAAGVVGSPLCLVAGRGKGQRRVVTAVTGGRLDVAQPWAVLPDSSSVYQLGGIQWQYRSGWFRWADWEEENPRRLEVSFEPTANPCTLDANLYLDRSAVPVTWQTDYTSADSNGFASVAGSPDLTADLTRSLGIVQKRLDGHRELYADGARYLRLGLSGVSAQDPVAIHQVTLDGAHVTRE